MKYVVAAILLAILVLKLVSLLPAEAAAKRGFASTAAWQGAISPIGAGAIDAKLAGQTATNSGVAQAQVVVSAQIQPVRLLVVDDEGSLIQVWSNGGEQARLEARRSTRNGPAVPVGDSLRAAYERVGSAIPAEAKGLVYQRP